MDGVSRVVNVVLVELVCVGRSFAKLFADHERGLAPWLCIA
jgi:hypothetical protein